MVIEENLFPHLPQPQIASAAGQAFKMMKFRVVCIETSIMISSGSEAGIVGDCSGDSRYL